MLSRLLHRLVNFYQPCVLCGAYDAGHGWCPACLESLPTLPEQRCSCCALPLAAPAPICGMCLKKRPAFDQMMAGFLFDYPLAALIRNWKYQPAYELSGAMAALVTQFACLSESYDWVVPVPLAKNRLAQRGFNQSTILGKTLSKKFALPYTEKICWRLRNTAPQASLNLANRHKNIQDAFGVGHEIKGLSVLLVDDVATSGATLSSLAGIMKKAGARRVDAWVLARAVLQKT